MMRASAFIIAVLLSAALCGCSENEDKSGAADAAPIVGEGAAASLADDGGGSPDELYDSNDEVIFSAENIGVMSLTDKGLFYSSVSGSADGSQKIFTCRFRDSDSGKITELGTIGNFLNESSHSRVLIGDHLYTVVNTRGNDDGAKMIYNLIDCDLKNGTMRTLVSEPVSSPYFNILGHLDGDLLAVRSDDAGTRIDRYDAESDSFETLLKYQFDNDAIAGGSIRGLYGGNDMLFVLWVEMNGEDDVKLLLDSYDKSMSLVSSEDISAVCSASGEEMSVECRQPVMDFFDINGILYYANRSISRFLGKVGKNGTEPMMESGCEEFNSAEAVSDVGSLKLFYKTVSEDNTVYILNTETGELKETAFFAGGENKEKYYIAGMFQYGDNVLIQMEDIRGNVPDMLEPKRYYVKIDDLLKQ